MFNDKYIKPKAPSQNENLTTHSKNSNDMIKNIKVISPQKAIA